MKCLVFSDSHGTPHLMRCALALHRDAEVVFFLGDGLADAATLASEDPTRAWIAVRGNCDTTDLFGSSFVRKVDEITLDGRKIVLTHGDLYGAKYGVGGLINLARERGADIVLFGHTHIPHEQYVGDYGKPVWLFNPGSISYNGASYGIITLGGTPLLSHGSIAKFL